MNRGTRGSVLRADISFWIVLGDAFHGRIAVVALDTLVILSRADCQWARLGEARTRSADTLGVAAALTAEFPRARVYRLAPS